MSTYDIIMLAILVITVLFGAWKGLAWQVAAVASIVVSYFVALNFSSVLAEMLQIEPPWNRLVAMLILFLGCSLAIWLVFARVKYRLEKWNLGGFDKQAGALVGGITGILLCMLTTMFGVSILGETAAEAICQSRSGGYIVQAIDRVTTVVPDEIHEIVKPYVDEFQQNIAHKKHDHPDGSIATQSQGFGNSGEYRVAETPGEFEEFRGTLQRDPSSPTEVQELGGLLNDALDGVLKDGSELLKQRAKERANNFIDNLGRGAGNGG